MNLEPIDTSTTAGKARVMQLAAEGRQVVWRFKKGRKWIPGDAGNWDWPQCDFAIVVEPEFPNEIFVQQRNGALWAYSNERDGSVRYRRADLAGRDE